MLSKSTAFQRSDVDSSYHFASEALVISNALQYTKGILGAYLKLASVMMIWGRNDSALFYCQKAIALSQSNNDYSRITDAKVLMSYIYQDKGNSDSSLLMVYEAMQYSKKANDSSGLCLIYAAMGIFYLEYKDYPKALYYHKQAYALSMKLNRLSAASDALEGIANVYYLTGKYRTALKYYLQIDSFSRMINEPTGVAQNQNNIALCYVDLRDKKKALFYYGLALEGYRKYNLRFEEANTYYNLGELYNHFSQPDSAIYYGLHALKLSQELMEFPGIAKCFLLLAKAYSNLGNYAKAFAYQEKYSVLSDSLLNTEKINSISEMQTKYETELKTQEIGLLQRENELARIKASRSLGINVGLASALLGILFVTYAFYHQNKKKEKLNSALQREKQKSDDLLLNILPSEVAEELKENGQSLAKQYNHVTVLFTDFVNFTGISEQLSPTELVSEIHQNFTAFDAIMDKHGLEKIKTIGDAYLAVCGLPNEVHDHAQRVVKAALAITAYMADNGGKFQVRIGVHTGPVVAGIVGVKKYAYDIWGDTVNTASRMESTSEAGKINVSAATYEIIKDEFTCEYRGKINAKNKGEVDMWFVKSSSITT